MNKINPSSDPASCFDQSVAARISYLRINVLQMTQSEFAQALNISQTYLSMIENGKKEVQKPIVDNILLTFNVNVEWLLFGMGGDDSIFLSETALNKEYFSKTSKEKALSELKKAFHLSQPHYEFVSRYLSLPPRERDIYLSIVNNIDDLIQLHQPDGS